jgi:hypothetical protein
VSSYAVVWRSDEGSPHAGRLELTEKALSLHGRDRRLVIPYAQVLGLERGSQTRIGRSRAIRIFTDSRNAGELLVATVGGVGLLSEIFTALQQALGG